MPKICNLVTWTRPRTRTRTFLVSRMSLTIGIQSLSQSASLYVYISLLLRSGPNIGIDCERCATGWKYLSPVGTDLWGPATLRYFVQVAFRSADVNSLRNVEGCYYIQVSSVESWYTMDKSLTYGPRDRRAPNHSREGLSAKSPADQKDVCVDATYLS